MTNGNGPEAKLIEGRQVVGDIRGGEEEISDPDDSPSIDNDTATFTSDESHMENEHQIDSPCITDV